MCMNESKYDRMYSVLTVLKEGNHFVNNILQLSVRPEGKQRCISSLAPKAGLQPQNPDHLLNFGILRVIISDF